jgi:NOL1/NOP2/fmu family ribosome biogenesis protein
MNILKEGLQTKLWNLLEVFINPFNLEDIKANFIFLENPQKRIVWIISNKMLQLKQEIWQEDFVNKVGIKFASYTKTDYLRLKTSGFQWLGNRIDKNFLDIDELEFNLLKTGFAVNTIFPYPQQVVLKWKNLPIGWGHIKDNWLTPKIPKLILEKLIDLSKKA